jgi:uncharacterized protein (TIGR02996 family)
MQISSFSASMNMHASRRRRPGNDDDRDSGSRCVIFTASIAPPNARAAHMLAPAMKVRRFEHAAKNRFWEVYWDLCEVEIVSGTIGSNGRAHRKDLESAMACAEYVTGEVSKRLKEGFEEVVPEVVKNKTAPRATPPPELLQRVLEAPDEEQPRMVYADWLHMQGDPLGELIAVQLELARFDPWTLPPKRLR